MNFGRYLIQILHVFPITLGVLDAWLLICLTFLDYRSNPFHSEAEHLFWTFFPFRVLLIFMGLLVPAFDLTFFFM